MTQDQWNFDEPLPPQQQQQQRKSSLFESPKTYAFILLIAIATGGGAWYFLTDDEADQGQEIPLLMADSSPIKTRPENAGEADVPHQDKEVYNRLAPTHQPKQLEQLLPAEEEPIMLLDEDDDEDEDDFPSTYANERTDTQDAHHSIILTDEEFKPVDPKTGQASIRNAQKATPKTPVKEEVPVATKVEEAKAEKTVEKAVAKIEKAAKPKETVKAAAQKAEPKASPAPETRMTATTKPNVVKRNKLQHGYRVQVASLPSKAKAEQEWARIFRAHPGEFGKMSPSYQRVDLGKKKGTYYRVQLGDFKSRADAKKFCDGLSTSCIVVKF
ncbi:MAG: SPOR domain-containing protein [Alphaproteobacteria bacterium]